MICREAMVPGGPCNTVMELVHDEQVADREMLLHIQDKKLGDTLQIGKAAKFSWDGKEDHVIDSAPLLGEDTDDYLAGINMGQAEIARLRADGVI